MPSESDNRDPKELEVLEGETLDDYVQRRLNAMSKEEFSDTVEEIGLDGVTAMIEDDFYMMLDAQTGAIDVDVENAEIEAVLAKERNQIN